MEVASLIFGLITRISMVQIVIFSLVRVNGVLRAHRSVSFFLWIVV